MGGGGPRHQRRRLAAQARRVEAVTGREQQARRQRAPCRWLATVSGTALDTRARAIPSSGTDVPAALSMNASIHSNCLYRGFLRLIGGPLTLIENQAEHDRPGCQQYWLQITAVSTAQLLPHPRDRRTRAAARTAGARRRRTAPTAPPPPCAAPEPPCPVCSVNNLSHFNALAC